MWGVRMTKFDHDYLELAKRILTEGVEVNNRTGINTIKVPEHYFKFDLSDEFPILQSKQTFYKNAILEMLWIWQMQSNDVRDLHENGVHIWDEWMIDDDGIYRIYEPITLDGEYDSEREVVVMDPYSVDVGNVNGCLKPKYLESGDVMKARSRISGKNIKAAKYYGKEYAYTIGTAYGYITRRYQHTQNLIYSLLNNPCDRRMVKSLWQDEFLRTAVLPSCVWSTEWDVTNGKLNLMVHQRSCDVALGLPFNVTQYACFLSMIAHVTHLEPGTISYSIKDAHIYVPHIQGIQKQIDRWNVYEKISSLDRKKIGLKYSHVANKFIELYNLYCDNRDNVLLKKEFDDIDEKMKMMEFILEYEKPELWLNPDVNDFFLFDHSKKLKDVKIKKYKHLDRIQFPIVQ